MTRNYLSYMANVETHRANVAHEKETNRHNLVTESETSRHNVATENETNRHNLVLEEQGWQQLAEIARHNYAIEAIQGGQLELGYAQLAEAGRHNRAQESIGYIGAQASQMQATAANIQAQVAQMNARTNSYNANTNRMNAETNEFNAETSRMDAETRENAQHLDLFRYSTQATTAQHQIQYDWEMYGLHEQRTAAEAFKDYTTGARNIGSTINEFAKTAESIGSDVLKLINLLKLAG